MQNIQILDGTPYLIAEKGGSRVLHKIGKRYELKVASQTWHDVLFFSEESGTQAIAQLKQARPFNHEAWKFELVRTSDFESAVIGGVQPSWFRIKKPSYPNLRSPEIGRTGFTDIEP